jgi:hypothetical protein
MNKFKTGRSVQMKQNLSLLILVSLGLILGGCDSTEQKNKTENTEEQNSNQQVNSDVLPFLNIQEKPAEIALPFCEQANCIDIDIQSIETQDKWLNTWISKNQAKVIQDQIDLNQDMTLQQAVNAYVKQSDIWQDEFKANKPFELGMYTRVAKQRNQYLLLQLGVDTKQRNLNVKERYYFFVADRRQNKTVKILDIINPKKQVKMNGIVQKAYGDWLKKQEADVRKQAPKSLKWGQADWFFDHEGIGLHFRTNEIAKEAQQLDIYLTKAQTQQVLKPEIYQNMF